MNQAQNSKTHTSKIKITYSPPAPTSSNKNRHEENDTLVYDNYESMSKQSNSNMNFKYSNCNDCSIENLDSNLSPKQLEINKNRTNTQIIKPKSNKNQLINSKNDENFNFNFSSSFNNNKKQNQVNSKIDFNSKQSKLANYKNSSSSKSSSSSHTCSAESNNSRSASLNSNKKRSSMLIADEYDKQNSTISDYRLGDNNKHASRNLLKKYHSSGAQKNPYQKKSNENAATATQTKNTISNHESNLMNTSPVYSGQNTSHMKSQMNKIPFFYPEHNNNNNNLKKY
jgi:hypothetical protein